jgi:hypothetical protein
MDTKPSNSSKLESKGKTKKMSNAPFILLIVFAFLLLGYQYFQYNKKVSTFENVIPYIAQSVYINIYTTPEDYPKYQWLFKGALLNSIRVSNGRGDFVMVPKTTVNIPINVYNNASKTRFSILANGIEQEIYECDFIGTTF